MRGLRAVVQILKEAAERFRALDDEAHVLCCTGGTGYNEKLQEKAQILVDLPGRLTSALGGVNHETRKLILSNVSAFAAGAQRAIKEGNFSLGVLLTLKGGKREDKNELEKLIDTVEISLAFRRLRKIL